MKLFTTLALIVGLALLVWILTQTDLVAAARIGVKVGWLGVSAIPALFCATWLPEIVAFGLIMPRRVVTAGWVWSLWLVNMVGEAFNVLLPLGSLGGEPAKALLLKRHYKVPLPEGTSTMFLMQTMMGIAEAPFALIGVVLVLRSHVLSPELAEAMAIAALVLAMLMALAIVALHMRWLNIALRRFERSRWGGKLAHVVEALDDVEQQMFTFVRRHPKRFASALIFFFANWVGGALEVWLVLYLIGTPVPLAHAWVIESAVVLIRSSTFFIPAHLGSLEAVTVLVTAAFTGSNEVGLALALVRRARELFWSGLGLAVGGWYNWRRPEYGP
jgi:glycosyltransferase 2 family protein